MIILVVIYMSKLNEILSFNLKKRLAELNMTQRELAEKTKISYKTLSHYFTGDTKATLDNLILICKELHCTIGYLVGIEGTKNNDIQAIMDYLEANPDQIPMVKRLLDIK